MLNGKKIAVLCMSQIHDIENSRFTHLLSEYLKKENISLWIYNMSISSYWNEEEISAESAVFDIIDFTKADIIILMHEKIQSNTISSRIIENAFKHTLPVIVVDGDFEGCVSVKFDYAKGFEKIVRHVVEEHGVRDLYFIGGEKGNQFSDEREKIFRAVLTEHKIKIDENMFGYGRFWADPAREAAKKIISERENLPKAIICANDIMAINVISVLKEEGFSIPQDIIVTGFDGIDDIYFNFPTVTSAKCSADQLASTISQATKACLNGHAENKYLIIPELLCNESCGCSSSFLEDNLSKLNNRFYRYQDDYNCLTKVCERIQASESISQAAWAFCDPIIHDLICIADKQCANREIDLFEEPDGDHNDMMVIFDSSNTKNILRPLSSNEIIPQIAELTEKGCTLIFNSITYMNRAYGYICFHFNNYNAIEYSKIPQTISCIGMGLGGFVTRQYQRFLQTKIEEIYKYDSLTGLLNRLSFYKEFETIRSDLIENKIPINIVFTDLDGLKKINDTFGHNAGDIAIATTAKALKNSVPENSLCVRFGGDEMLAVIVGEYDNDKLKCDFNNCLKKFNDTSGVDFIVSASIGIHKTLLSEKFRLEDLFSIADEEMYKQKIQKKMKLNNNLQ